MYSKEWFKIIRNLSENPIEFPTVPKTNRTPVWFSATTDGEAVFINVAIKNKPSSNLSMERKLNYNTFEKIYPIYLKRKNGEQVSCEATSLTVDQVYYYSLIKHLCDS